MVIISCRILLPESVKWGAYVSYASDKILELFDKTGAYLRGHFRLTSGLHSPEYLQCALVLQHPRHADYLGTELARVLAERGLGDRIDIVVAPAMGGLIIGHEAARALGARFLFTERDAERKMTLRRGFKLRQGERAVVIEDVITTGGSLCEVVDLLKESGVEVVAAGSIIDRSGGSADLGVPRIALATLKATTYEAAECPLCRDGLPVQKPGSRAS